jgi:hypothetical protein
MIQIGPEQCHLKTNHKFQINNVIPFKVLQRIELNSYIIKLSLNFDINFTFDMKNPIIYKLQHIFDAFLRFIPHYPYHYHTKKYINATLDAQVVFARNYI